MKRSGEYVTNLSGDMQYRSFRPSNLPFEPVLNIDEELIKKLINANNAFAKLNTSSELIKSSELFISMYVRKEALISSQIEGTQCTLDDVLNPNISRNVNLDVKEVINYVNAVNYAVDRLKNFPLCNRLLKEIHKILVTGAKGEDKSPGEFRRSQNWIGSSNSDIKNARYIPPNVEDMKKALSNLEQYINNGNDYDPLISASLIHYQFETIHPFLDGNGRVGRMLILLYLMEQKYLNKPIIYISYFLKKNQIEYYDRMSEVRRTGNYEQWVKFFLDALSASANDSYNTIIELNKLHEQNLKILETDKNNKKLITIFEYLEQHPIIEINKTAKDLNMAYNTASKMINIMNKKNILSEITNASRNRIFVYNSYLEILRKDT